MVRNRRALTRLGIALVVAAVSILLDLAPPVYAVSSHRALNDTRAVGSAPVAVAFPIEYFGVVGDLPTPSSRLAARGASPYGQARFRVQGHWTAWQALDQDGAQEAGHFTSSLVSVARADAYQVRGLPAAAGHWRAAAINTTDGPSVVVGHRRGDAAAASSTCMSRADWGADESISGWSRGDVPTYFPVQTLTVHHTAGSNDLGQDYAATVRAIYSYHVQTNGWSDIGYQYLIDGAGKVYEGRRAGHVSASCLSGGGTGADFAHQSGTDDVVTGAHVAGFNSGNVGVALMGCFEASTECSGSTTPPAAAKDALESLLASLATRHHLDPQGTVHYVNPVNGTTKDVATISGHRDWEATACPGGKLYADLPNIRTDVASRMAPPPPPPTNPTPPGAPSSLSATATGSAVALTWSAPPGDAGAPLSRYELFRSTSTPVAISGTALYSGLATSFNDQRTPGTYYYAVRACSSAGCGPTTAAGPVTVLAAAKIVSGSCAGATCTFSGTGSGTLTWTFGNGTSRTGSPAAGTYTRTGSYTVTLTDGQPTRATRAVSCSTVKRALRCTT